jgi:anaerobic selenocysteine-containing dehydrogenase
MKNVKTMCARDCYDSCFTRAVVRGNGEEKLISVKGDPYNLITRGFTCPRGARDVFRVYNNRVLFPRMRIEAKPGREFRRATWEEALEHTSSRLAETLRVHGGKSVLLLDYSGNTGLLTSEFPQRLWYALGASRTDGALCSRSGQEGLSLHYGASYGLQPEELPGKDLIVFWGFNAPVSAPHFWALSVQARKRKRLKIIVVDPRQDEAAWNADFSLHPRPGGDVALAMGVCRCLIENGRVDDRFIQNRTLGFDELKKEALSWTPARVEKETGLKWSEVETLAWAYGNSGQSATMIGIGMQKNVNGADMVRAVSFIPGLRGLHRGFFYSNGDAFFIDKGYISGRSLVDRQPEIFPQTALSEYVRQGAFKFIFVCGMNPALTVPNQEAFREGLCGRDTFTVVHDSHWTGTSDYADVVLPAPTFFEKRDVVVPWSHRYIRLSPRAIDPVGESRDEVWLMRQLARHLGLETPWLFEDPWKELEKAFEGAFLEGTFADLVAGKDMVLKCKPADRYATPSGKLEFYSSAAGSRGWTPLPRHSAVQPGEGEFILLNSASANYTSTQFQEAYGAIPAVVHINGKDARRLGITNDDALTLSNSQGSISLKARVKDSVPPGVLWSPRQLADLEGRSLNHLTPGAPQTIGGGAPFNSTLVTVSPGKENKEQV